MRPSLHGYGRGGLDILALPAAGPGPAAVQLIQQMTASPAFAAASKNVFASSR